MLIQILSKSEKVGLSESGDFILSICVLGAEHAVDCQPYLCLYLGDLVGLVLGHLLPLLIFELLDFSSTVLPQPWLELNKWNKHTRHITNLHQLMHNGNWQLMQVVGDEPHQTEGNDTAIELDFVSLLLQLLHWRHVHQSFRVHFGSWLRT